MRLLSDFEILQVAGAGDPPQAPTCGTNSSGTTTCTCPAGTAPYVTTLGDEVKVSCVPK